MISNISDVRNDDIRRTSVGQKTFAILVDRQSGALANVLAAISLMDEHSAYVVLIDCESRASRLEGAQSSFVADILDASGRSMRYAGEAYFGVMTSLSQILYRQAVMVEAVSSFWCPEGSPGEVDSGTGYHSIPDRFDEIFRLFGGVPEFVVNLLPYGNRVASMFRVGCRVSRVCFVHPVFYRWAMRLFIFDQDIDEQFANRDSVVADMFQTYVHSPEHGAKLLVTQGAGERNYLVLLGTLHAREYGENRLQLFRKYVCGTGQYIPMVEIPRRDFQEFVRWEQMWSERIGFMEERVARSKLRGDLKEGTNAELLDVVLPYGRMAVNMVTNGRADDFGERAILYLHGGSYKMGSITTYSGNASRISDQLGIAVLVPEFPSVPEVSAEFQLRTLVEVYQWLTQQTKSVIVMGDSGGCVLCMALMHRVFDYGDAATPPSSIVLLSPTFWHARADMFALAVDEEARFIETERMWYRLYTHFQECFDIEHPEISPGYLSGSREFLDWLPPTLIEVGTRDLSLLQADLFFNSCKATLRSCRIRLQLYLGATHVWQWRPGPLADLSFSGIRNFLARCYASPISSDSVGYHKVLLDGAGGATFRLADGSLVDVSSGGRDRVCLEKVLLEAISASEIEFEIRKLVASKKWEQEGGRGD